MTVNMRLVAIIVVAAMVLGIGGAMIGGVWITEGSKTPRSIAEGDFAGKPDPAEIKGSYSIADVEKAFGVPAARFIAAFGLPADTNPGEFLMKNLEQEIGELEIGTDSARLFVARFTGLPYAAKEGTGIFQSTFDELVKAGKMTAEQTAEAKAMIVAVEAATPEPAIAAVAATPKPTTVSAVAATVKPTPNPQSQASPRGTGGGQQTPSATHTEATFKDDPVIKGKTTFADLLSVGITKAEIENAMGKPYSDATVAIRDFCNANGIEFSTIKNKLQSLVNVRM